MLSYSNDKRYIIQKDKRTGKITKILGPYESDMLPEIHNNDGTERSIHSIPKTSEESVYQQYSNLRPEFIRFIDSKYQNMNLKDIKENCAFKAEFRCSTCKNKWITRIGYRAKNGQQCPFCCKYKISFPEKYLFYCIEQINNNIQENYKIQGMHNMEFDMYDPALKFAIEFSSGMYHSDTQDNDERKLQYAISQNVKLIRIWQLKSVKQVDKLSDDEYIIPESSSINGVPDLNIIIDDICQQYALDQSLIDRKHAQDQAFLRTNKNPEPGKSLISIYPDLCRDWNYDKNGVIHPEMIHPRSAIKVHWKCMYCGKEWIQQPGQRTDQRNTIRAGCLGCNQKIRFGSLKEIPYIPDNKSNKA